jgi:hypothetical protein
VRRPWAIIVVAVVSALVAAGALVTAAQVGKRPPAAPTASPTPTTPDVGVDGCKVDPCQVLATAPVAGTTIELLADRGARSGRLRIGGPGSSSVIEATVTELGVTLTPESLQCLAGSLSACLVRGAYDGGLAGQVVVGRSGKWSSLLKPFVSDAGYLALAEVTADVGPELVAVQHHCDRASTPDCTRTPVFAQVFSTTGAVQGCTRDYDSLERLPGYPAVEVRSNHLSPC